MTKQEVRELILEVGIVPVVRGASAEQAMMAVEAVYLGGIPIVEITMTVPGALGVIREVARTMGSSVLVGAGTVLDVVTAQRCLEAGAEFVVSPGLDLPTIEFARKEEKVMMAGALTPTEIITAWKAGADFVKIFPCGEVGGARYIKALRGPLPQVRMVPTGGVDLSTVADFMRAGAAALGVGGELIQAEALKAGRPGIITANARRFVAAVKEARAQLGTPKEAAFATVS
ncbi:MAG: bifunctional 4-hydroxy-2-oxoglutarate aldolase/2-dehydro-3-deoxy-phosphogluconate aldolase [Acidobacteriia bacterium]|nr:bifunctional 4-hydroxy-2-oxoglutarate aldolase/2-dehydro-3-deoxy-phosphogluconate aldolase [Terriglobia bacterium]